MVKQVRAPKGGTRIGGKFYKGGEFVSTKYSRGGQILRGQPQHRLVDPSWEDPEFPPNYGREFVPHIATFIGVESSFSKAYRYSDEALKHSVQNAHMMLNDPAVFEPLNTRILHTCQLNWHIEPENSEDPRQKHVAEELTSIMKMIPQFSKYLYTLSWAVWFGRYAVENQYNAFEKNGRRYYGIKRWIPLSGDKILFRFDDGTGKYDPEQIGLRMSPAIIRADEVGGIHELEPTYDGLAYFLKPWERKAFVLHRYILMDGEFESPRDAGRIHGVGLRSFLYWTWYQKQETLAQLVEIVERSAAGFTIYYYPEGNAEAKAEVEKIAKTQAHTNIIVMPRSADGNDSYEPQVIPANTSGIDALNDLIVSRFDHPIKRAILGQVLSSESEATGLGSGVATFQKDTLANIIKYDAANLEETVTRELLWVLRDMNFPEWRDTEFRFYLDTETSDPQKDLAALRQGWEMGAEFREQAVHDILGTTPPREGERKLYNPVILQQIRLADEQLQESGQHSALAQAVGGQIGAGQGVQPEGGDEMQGEQPVQIDTQTTREAGDLSKEFYGDYMTGLMGGTN